MKLANLILTLLISFSVFAADTPQPKSPASTMNNEKLASLVKRLDNKVEGKPGFWRLHIENHEVTVITDEKADRMQILVPVTRVELLKENELTRLMQSNFDSALDARYAIAIHT